VTEEIDIRRGRHCIFLMQVPLVFVVRYRRRVFDQDAIGKLRSYFASVCTDFDVELVEIEDESDHVHLLINYPPKLAVSNVVNSLRGLSGRLLQRDRPDIAARNDYKGALWTPGYAVVRQYPSSGNTLSNSKHPIRWKTAPYIPALKDGALRCTG
jgi:putative transposase